VKRLAVLAVALALALAAAACDGGGPTPCAPGWKTLVDSARLPAPLLSAWGPSADALWLVGGPVGASAGGQALVLRSPLATPPPQPGRSETLWWVWGPDDGSEAWMVGEQGLVLRARGGAYEKLDAGVSTATLYGVWGTGPSDVWIVGGTPGGGTRAENDVIRHWDGQAWSARDAPPAMGAAYFKVWGSGPGALWVVGEGGTAWRRTATGWEDHSLELGTRASVTTVHGCSADEVYAVAGMDLFVWRGSRWDKAAGVTPLSVLNGVACGAAGVLAVGNGGAKLRFDRASGRWLDETLQGPFSSDFHGALVLADGRMLAVGGDFNAPPASKRFGLTALYGCPVPP
jgi:hypothetical protein